ncbi:MAG: beta-ketoacyl synthase N-terminal-like domain-containing protein, partial [Giesbergeria sp.]
AGHSVEGYSSTAAVASMGPNRMSFLLDLHGPSEPIETACSSALVAVHRAVGLLQSGQCELAVVGGVNTLSSPEAHISFSKAGMLSTDGRCKTFSKHANGYVRGEGVGMLVLKPLSHAQRDGDHIHGVILGSAENHGGKANSLTAPNPKAQSELIQEAMHRANVPVWSVGYVEAHGTGTPLGDPIEVQGLKSAYKALGHSGEHKRCGLGSVKSNVGHLELAAGVAGLIKVLLQMKHKTLAPTLHAQELNPYIDLQDSPFYVVNEIQPWQAVRDEQGRELPRRAGVSSFGFGGVNAHVVLEEYVDPAPQPLTAAPPDQPAAVLVVLSARDALRLQEQVRQLLAALEKGHVQPHQLRDLAYTLQVGRDAMEVRLACVVGSLQELQDKLRAYEQGQTPIEALVVGEVKRNKDALTIFAADEDLQMAIENWISKGKLDKLAQLWVKGLAVRWQRLYGQACPRRLSLPTYPFARDRYWVSPEARAPQRMAAMPETATRLHPLVHRNTSTLERQRYSSWLQAQAFYLQDHV